MTVSSPTGELPFEPRKLTIRPGGIQIEGAMGAWHAHVQIDPRDLPAHVQIDAHDLPAHVQIDARDLPALARLLAWPAAVTAAAAITVTRLAARRRTRR